MKENCYYHPDRKAKKSVLPVVNHFVKKTFGRNSGPSIVFSVVYYLVGGLFLIFGIIIIVLIVTIKNSIKKKDLTVVSQKI